jgi:hypothetical protein
MYTNMAAMLFTRDVIAAMLCTVNKIFLVYSFYCYEHQPNMDAMSFCSLRISENHEFNEEK